jgi:hypothetical protein
MVLQRSIILTSLRSGGCSPLNTTTLGRQMKDWARLSRLTVMTGLFAAVVGTSGCSYFEQFFVVNSSPGPLTVIAAASVYPHAETGERICAWSFPGQPPTEFKGIEASRLRKDYIPWNQFSKSAIRSFDGPSCSVHVTVEPGTAVLVWSSSNGRRTPFLTTLTLGERGEVIEGRDLTGRFRKRSRAVYVLEHK